MEGENMHKLSIKALKPGMVIGRSIYNPEGCFLLTRGQVLTITYIQRLTRLNIPSVYVLSGNPILDISPETDDIVKEKTRTHALQNVFAVFNNCQLTESINVDFMKQTASSIVEDLISNHNNLIQVTDIRRYDDYTFSHSVNVAILSTMLGTMRNYTKSQLNILTLGALLHDIGKTKTPIEILKKPRKLVPFEEEIMRRHPLKGAEILERASLASDIPIYIAQQHHEKCDGTGYPHQLQGEEINEFAKIVAIADVYDALTSDRPYKKAYRPDLAFNIMTKFNASHFDANLLQLFFDNVAIYPVGTILKLNEGSYAIVVHVQTGRTQTPIVHIIADKNMKPFKNPKRVDLYQNRDLQIELVLDEYELMAIFSTFNRI